MGNDLPHLFNFIRLLLFKQFLYIGCGGTGRVIDKALKNEFEITGIDVSSEMIRLSKEKYPYVNLINGDFIEWETKDQFDLILAICCHSILWRLYPKLLIIPKVQLSG